ncbi:MAG: hypothetical protein GY851_01215, partial [bacterium]|nr:hypothetical protein [bacterium]
RSRPRTVDAWNGAFPNMPVPPIEGETVLGSKIAVLGCAASEALDRIADIELAEGLPHPEFDGVWSRKWSGAGRPYLISGFSEDNVEEMLEYVRRANLASLYHSDAFTSWGHYELNPRSFPNGNDGMKQCVEKARALGIRIGVHTLSNFINTNDPYVTPVPDPRLAKTGVSQLVADIDADAKEIPVASPEYFNNEHANWLHTVMIGQELIRYRAVSEQEPWMLLDCRRGAFKTQKAAHKQGDEVAKLLDHAYKVFMPNFELSCEIAANLANLFNETGIGHMDFDGHEGGWSTGQGDYGVEMFSKTFYDNLKQPVVNGSSRSNSYYWHINTVENWGEPWYGGFRASQADYRFNNQAFYQR